MRNPEATTMIEAADMLRFVDFNLCLKVWSEQLVRLAAA